MHEDRRLRYLRAKPIALAALDLALSEREGYLANACGGDDALHDEVRWLLEAAETTNTPGFVPKTGAALVDESGSLVSAATNSDYRILRRLGEGGMGVVYLAERTAGEIRQQVALKFLHASGLPGGETLRRFTEERRILATLNHPHIAHLVDGGSTADGRPFLALEYVEGESIDQWCEAHHLSLRERVALFLKACAAVQYAHQQLVIHRDIKPANILVTAEGEPKLLDFGIARLLDDYGVSAAQTVTAQRALTLAYASPEQIRGQPLGTAADIWSLGVVLYQLVCGVRPFRETDSALDLSNAIVTGRLVPPSRQRAAKVSAALRGKIPADIDAIVMKALRQNPTERYPSVDEFSADLHRFLAARPVRAWQGAGWYRAQLFMRRNRLGLGVAALLLAVLGVFMLQREAQLRRVELERDKTQAIAGFMSELFENADPTHARGNTITVREVLDRGATQLKARQDIAPAVKAALLLSIGRSYIALDEGAKAVPIMLLAKDLQTNANSSVLERGQVMAALGRAYGLQTELQPSIAADQQAIKLLTGAPGVRISELFTARIHVLYQHVSANDMPAAQSIGQLRQIVRELDALNPLLPEQQVQALTTLSVALSNTGDDRQAVAVATQALTIAEGFYGKNDPALLHPRFILALTTSHTDPATAVRLYAQLIADRERMLGNNGEGLAALYSYRGFAVSMLGRHREASKMLEHAVTLAAAESLPRPDFQDSLLTVLANEYLELGRYADAAALLRPQLEQFAQRAADHSPWALSNQAAALNVMAIVAMHEGQLDEAQRLYTQLQTTLEPSSHAMPDAAMTTLNGVGLLQVAQHRYGEAQQTLDRFDAFNRDAKAAADSAGVLNARLLQVRLLHAQGKYPQAAEIAGQAVAVAQQRRDGCDRLERDLHHAWQGALAAMNRSAPALQCRPTGDESPDQTHALVSGGQP